MCPPPHCPLGRIANASNATEYECAYAEKARVCIEIADKNDPHEDSNNALTGEKGKGYYTECRRRQTKVKFSTGKTAVKELNQ